MPESISKSRGTRPPAARRLFSINPIATAALLLVAGLLVRHHRTEADSAQSAGMRLPAPQMFTTSEICQACHNGLTAQSGEDVSIGFDWRSSMMANSARDPYWQAAVRREMMDHAEAGEAIQNECSRCHMPMSSYRSRLAGVSGEVFSHLPIGAAALQGNRDATLAADGVSCATCHQITDTHFGARESFVGHFVIDSTMAWDQRMLFGPFAVDSGRTRVMQSASAFLPEEASHVQQSELCATCHTLFTHALDADHQVAGELPEQVPYLEWLHSSYPESHSCQSCHMPRIDGQTAVASVLGQPREEVNRHVFRGGNFFMPRLLNRYATELGVSALATELDATAMRTVEHLKNQSARLTVENVSRSANVLAAEVLVENLAGHKLPTAYPSRRVWLHLRVLDRAGTVLFESGKFNTDGSITGNDNDASADRFEPHYAIIDSPDKVQIYESIMLDPQGEVTTGITSGLSYAKDNRLLPDGFDKESAGQDVAVQGEAIVDQRFAGGEHRILLRADVAGSTGPFRVEAELWYQPISYRWAQNLRSYDSMETQRFLRYYESMSANTALLLTRASATADP